MSSTAGSRYNGAVEFILRDSRPGDFETLWAIDQVTGTRWGRAYSQVNGFVARHPAAMPVDRHPGVFANLWHIHHHPLHQTPDDLLAIRRCRPTLSSSAEGVKGRVREKSHVFESPPPADQTRTASSVEQTSAFTRKQK